MSGDQEKTLAAGCDGYLAKPLDDDVLFDKLEELLDD
jgi:CheY-like chemotaxis protein